MNTTQTTSFTTMTGPDGKTWTGRDTSAKRCSTTNGLFFSKCPFTSRPATEDEKTLFLLEEWTFKANAANAEQARNNLTPGERFCGNGRRSGSGRRF